mmetsp:Transcript_26691/g.67253  ORF Transcript_26691/g.67253 Transcript_26691/m.67253 type:complete len:222 (-) Transcript_26691:1928-2593(-)
MPPREPLHDPAVDSVALLQLRPDVLGNFWELLLFTEDFFAARCPGLGLRLGLLLLFLRLGAHDGGHFRLVVVFFHAFLPPFRCWRPLLPVLLVVFYCYFFNVLLLRTAVRLCRYAVLHENSRRPQLRRLCRCPRFILHHDSTVLPDIPLLRLPDTILLGRPIIRVQTTLLELLHRFGHQPLHLEHPQQLAHHFGHRPRDLGRVLPQQPLQSLLLRHGSTRS